MNLPHFYVHDLASLTKLKLSLGVSIYTEVFNFTCQNKHIINVVFVLFYLITSKVERFHRLSLPRNWRPTQPLNGRRIFRNFPVDHNDSSQLEKIRVPSEPSGRGSPQGPHPGDRHGDLHQGPDQRPNR